MHDGPFKLGQDLPVREPELFQGHFVFFIDRGLFLFRASSYMALSNRELARFLTAALLLAFRFWASSRRVRFGVLGITFRGYFISGPTGAE